MIDYFIEAGVEEFLYIDQEEPLLYALHYNAFMVNTNNVPSVDFLINSQINKVMKSVYNFSRVEE